MVLSSCAVSRAAKDSVSVEREEERGKEGAGGGEESRWFSSLLCLSSETGTVEF